MIKIQFVHNGDAGPSGELRCELEQPSVSGYQGNRSNLSSFSWIRQTGI